MRHLGIPQRIARAYTFYSPIQKGKYRIADLSLRFSHELPREMLIKATDGRELVIDSANESYKYLYFTGVYEPAITAIFRALVKPGDVCLDIGANIGWFTTLFQQLTGRSGTVHSFEPTPPIFEKLQNNLKLNPDPNNVILNNVALGDEEKEIELHIFPNLPDGHASIATFDRKDFETFSAKMITLDSYLTTNKIHNVSIAKVDIEGAELMMLKGASNLFSQKQMPVLEIEMALATSKGFGYTPNDLIEFISTKGDYIFYKIDERKLKLTQIKGFANNDIGANVLCLPKNHDSRNLAKWMT